MSKQYSKTVCVILIIILLLSLFAGCGTKPSDEITANNPTMTATNQISPLDDNNSTNSSIEKTDLPTVLPTQITTAVQVTDIVSTTEETMSSFLVTSTAANSPSQKPTFSSTPTMKITATPSLAPTKEPTLIPTATPSPTPSPTPTLEPTEKPTEAPSWLDLTEAVLSGGYICGVNIKSGKYIVTCSETSWKLSVITFNSVDNFNGYYNSNRYSNAKEAEARGKYALTEAELYGEGKSCYVNLTDGDVLYLEGGTSMIRKYDGQGADSNLPFPNYSICSGVFIVGQDIKAGQYDLSCPSGYMNAALFESMDDYLNYHRTSRLTNGEEEEAKEKYASSIFYVSSYSEKTVNLNNGNILLLEDGLATIRYQSGELSNTDSRSGKSMSMPQGTYFVGERDIEAGQYVLTCTDVENYSMTIYVFNNTDDYYCYYRSERFTNGQEMNAVEQNAFADFYLEASDRIILNLRSGMIVVLLSGSGIAETIITDWK